MPGVGRILSGGGTVVQQTARKLLRPIFLWNILKRSELSYETTTLVSFVTALQEREKD